MPLTHADLNAVLNGGAVNEDVLQQIIDVSRLPLEFTDRCGGGSISNKAFSWTMDRLQAQDLGNASIDGADVDQNDAATGQRVWNQAQLSDKEVKVSLLGEAADSIGGMGKISRQVNRRGQELMRDIEGISMSNQGAVVDDGTAVAGTTAGLEAWLDGKILVPSQTGVASWTQTAARQDLTAGDIDGGGFEDATSQAVGPDAWTYTTPTPVAITQTAIDAVILALFRNTGSRKNRVLMSRPEVHSKISAFYFDSTARVATLQSQTAQTASSPAQANTAVNAILTDYGIVDLVPNALQPIANAAGACDTAFILDFSTLECPNFTGFRVTPLAKTGHSEKRLLSKSWAFRPLATESQGIIQGIDATAAMTA